LAHRAYVATKVAVVQGLGKGQVDLAIRARDRQRTNALDHTFMRKQLFPLNQNCFHLDFGVPTPPINLKTFANHANPGDEQVVQSLVRRRKPAGTTNWRITCIDT
jgi:hypothetical protein